MWTRGPDRTNPRPAAGAEPATCTENCVPELQMDHLLINSQVVTGLVATIRMELVR